MILYVDDDPDCRLAMRQILQANGIPMVEAEDGESGFRAFKEHNPSLILVDLMMEEIDSGVNFLRQVRAAGSTAPVYLVSSVGDSLAMTTSADDLGFTGVFQKPFDNQKFISVIKKKLTA